MGKIILVNEICSDNIGDHAINRGATKLLNSYGYDVESHGFNSIIMEKVDNIDFKRSSFLLKIVKRIIREITKRSVLIRYFEWIVKNNRRVRRVMMTNKGGNLIIGGGQLIQSGGTFPIALYTWCRHARKNRVKVFILGVGCAEKFGRFDKIIFKNALESVSLIRLREHESIHKLSSEFQIESSYIPDLAYALYSHDRADYVKNDQVVIGATAYYVYKKNISELGVQNYLSFDEYTQHWISKIERELEAGNRVLLVSTTEEDSKYNSFIFSKLISKDDVFKEMVTIIDNTPSLDEYMNILSGARKVYSGRMHSLILGHINMCNVNPYNISKKLEYFSNEYLGQDCSHLSNMLDSEMKKLIKQF
jgi:polysaccharide pyruvyl transferase WcaK-like protein